MIHRLTIDPARLRCGLAKRLIDFAEEFAAAGGYDCIRLDAFTRNPPAVEKKYPVNSILPDSKSSKKEKQIVDFAFSVLLI